MCFTVTGIIPRQQQPAFHDKWFRTGDLGAIDADGYVSILGRIKELIIVGGTNVTPGEVEVVLETDVGVAECAVVGIPDTDLGERITAFIVPRAGEDTTALEARLRTKAEHDLAPYKRPRVYRFLDAVPRNAMGKGGASKVARTGDRKIKIKRQRSIGHKITQIEVGKRKKKHETLERET